MRGTRETGQERIAAVGDEVGFPCLRNVACGGIRFRSATPEPERRDTRPTLLRARVVERRCVQPHFELGAEATQAGCTRAGWQRVAHIRVEQSRRIHG